LTGLAIDQRKGLKSRINPAMRRVARGMAIKKKGADLSIGAFRTRIAWRQ
jgi:hypothetical protein